MVARRQLMSGLTAGNTIIGFDTHRRKWVTSASTSGSTFDGAPTLDGVLTLDDVSRDADSQDQGNIVFNIPAAVLRPGSVADIQEMVKFCRARGVEVAARGAGHTTFGQGLVNSGLIIEMRWLNTIYSVGVDGAEADAGVLWRDLVQLAAAEGLRVASGLPGYLGLTIGGTLSVGGASTDYREGGLVDRVQRVEVVSGRGERFLCSPTAQVDLFNAVLGGLGQCGVITRARIDMLPAPTRVRTYQLTYTDSAALFKDLRLLRDRGEVDKLYCLWQSIETNVSHQLHAHVYYDLDSPPHDTFVLRDVSAAPVITDQTYLEHVLSDDSAIEGFRALGYDSYIKPWFDVWLPDSSVESYVEHVIPGLGPSSWSSTGFVLLIMHKRAAMTRPFFRVPDQTEWVYLFDILNDSGAPGPEPAFTSEMLNRNRTLWAQAKAAGAIRYPIGTLEFTHDDWVQHYGDAWSTFRSMKNRFDPDGILTPGLGIFP